MRNRLGHPLPILAVLVLLVASLAPAPAPVAALASAPAPAAAHAHLSSSTPANGAAVRAVPPDVVLSFGEPVANGPARVSASITLTGPPSEVSDLVVTGANVRLAVDSV